MKIKKVDDKPMTIHTKQKAKIHSHEPKQAAIKGSNIYTVNRGPKVVKAEVSKAPAQNGATEYRMQKGKKTYRKSTFVLSLLRKGIVDLPLMLLANRLWPMYGVMLVQPFMEFLGATIALYMYHKLHQTDTKQNR